MKIYDFFWFLYPYCDIELSKIITEYDEGVNFKLSPHNMMGNVDKEFYDSLIDACGFESRHNFLYNNKKVYDTGLHVRTLKIKEKMRIYFPNKKTALYFKMVYS